MKEWTSNMLAVSLAGHDKGFLYVVLAEENAGTLIAKDSDYLLLADGKHHTLDHPKRKKRKHVQTITHLSEDLIKQMSGFSQDAQIRKIIKSYETGQSR